MLMYLGVTGRKIVQTFGINTSFGTEMDVVLFNAEPVGSFLSGSTDGRKGILRGHWGDRWRSSLLLLSVRLVH